MLWKKKKDKKKKNLIYSNLISFNKYSSRDDCDEVFGFELEFLPLYQDMSGEDKSVHVDFASNDDIDILIEALEELKEL